MIQPLGMINSAMPMIKPVQFNERKLQNGSINNQAQAYDFGSRELTPNIKNSKMGQKLDFFA